MRVRGACSLQAISVFLGVFELQRVFGDLGQGQHLEAGIEQQRQPRVGADAAMMLAFRADREVRLVFLHEQHFLTRRALDPQILLRGLLLLGKA
jgi:hypothetical protein